MSNKLCYDHQKSIKPHPLCGCLKCNTNRRLYVEKSFVECIGCHCRGYFGMIKPGHPNQCNVCGHSFTKHYCN